MIRVSALSLYLTADWLQSEALQETVVDRSFCALFLHRKVHK